MLDAENMLLAQEPGQRLRVTLTVVLEKTRRRVGGPADRIFFWSTAL